MYPVSYDVEYGDGTRSRGLAVLGILFFLKALLLIPHIIVLLFLYIAAAITTFVGYIVVLFTGKLPEGMFNFIRGVMAWWVATTAWLYGNTDEYPPFTLNAPATYPSQLTVDYADGKRSRGLAIAGILYFIKALMALPHLIIVGVLGYAAGIAAWMIARSPSPTISQSCVGDSDGPSRRSRSARPSPSTTPNRSSDSCSRRRPRRWARKTVSSRRSRRPRSSSPTSSARCCRASS